MSRRRRPDINAGLRRLRAASLLLGGHSYHVQVLDQGRGRPAAPRADLERICYADSPDLFARIANDCHTYLRRAGLRRAWFRVFDRVQVLGGGGVTLRAGEFDLLCNASSLFSSFGSTFSPLDLLLQPGCREMYPCGWEGCLG